MKTISAALQFLLIALGVCLGLIGDDHAACLYVDNDDDWEPC